MQGVEKNIEQRLRVLSTASRRSRQDAAGCWDAQLA
jgi:hypothetical protein